MNEFSTKPDPGILAMIYYIGRVTRYFFENIEDQKNFYQEDKLKLSKNRGQISKIEGSPLKNQADGQPIHRQQIGHFIN